jgi:hypothetical protein
MANSKVILHPLERLDLVDINALQDLIHNALLSHTGQLVGSQSFHCVLNKWAGLTVDNTNHLIQFQDFTFLGQMYDDTTVAGLAGYVGRFAQNNSSNGDCSFDAARAAVQVYFDANGALPPAPADDDYSHVSHAAYYPLIYVKPVSGEQDSGPRRFWSVADATETTTEVNTRVGYHCVFTLSTDYTLPSGADASSDFPYSKIARITRWTESGGVVSLADSGITAFGMADVLLDLVGPGQQWDFYHTNSTNVGGLSHAFYILKQKIIELTQRGQNDPGLTGNTRFEDEPLMSLNGMYKAFGDRLTALENGSPRSSAVIYRTFDADSDYDNFFVYQSAGSDFDLACHADYTPFYEAAYDENGDLLVNPLAAPVNLPDLNDGKRTWNFFWTFGLVLPADYAGRGVQVTVTPIQYFRNLDNWTASDGGGIIPDLPSSELARGNQWHIVAQGQLQDASKESVAGLINNVSALPVQDVNGDAPADTYGMIFKNDIIHSESNTTEQLGAAIYLNTRITWAVKVDVTVL